MEATAAPKVEREAVSVGLRLVRPLVEARLQEAQDAADARPVCEAACGRCGGGSNELAPAGVTTDARRTSATKVRIDGAPDGPTSCS